MKTPPKPYLLLSASEESAARRRIARLRSQMFDKTEEEQIEAGREIERLKAQCADTWDSRAAQHRAEALTRMGY